MPTVDSRLRALTPSERATLMRYVLRVGGQVTAARGLGLHRETIHGALAGYPLQRRSLAIIQDRVLVTEGVQP